MPEPSELALFEQTVLPHLDAAYNLARWLTRDDANAQDLVQEACLRALRFFDGFHGTNGRAWLLTIVRNTCYTWLKEHRKHEVANTSFDEEMHSVESSEENPEGLLLRKASKDAIQRALEELPVEFREVMVLRELEGLSYKEIAGIAEIPIGTVMSRLARARKRLQESLTTPASKE